MRAICLEFEVFPNPTSGELNVNLTQYTGRAVHLNVYSIEGLLLRSVKMDEVQTTLATIDLSDHPNGMYLIQAKSEGLPDVTKQVVLAR